MSRTDERLIKDVEERLDQLIRLCHSQAEHLGILSAEKDRLASIVREQEVQIRDLSRQLSVATMALQESPDAHLQLGAFKREIDAVVKEVEGCIAYLEKNV